MLWDVFAKKSADILGRRNSFYYLYDMGEGGVKNPEKMPTSFMDGPNYAPLKNRHPNIASFESK